MGKLVEIVNPLHVSTQRNYLSRMLDNKVECMGVAKAYDQRYWDGDRRYGYGGYKYIPGRWEPVAKALVSMYNLSSASSVLDIGCGKGFLLHELKLLIPDIRICGIDISDHALRTATVAVRPFLKKFSAIEVLEFSDSEFDLVISLATLHNFRISELRNALSEIRRVGKQQYLMVESYRNDQELFNLQCWALTCATFLDPDEWKWIFKEFGYSGDFEFIYFA